MNFGGTASIETISHTTNSAGIPVILFKPIMSFRRNLGEICRHQIKIAFNKFSRKPGDII